MGYTLEAVIARADLLRQVVAFGHGRVVPLEQGFALLPMTQELVEEVQDDAGESAPAGFIRMPDGFIIHLREWSKRGPLIFVEADYFAGLGDQWAGTFSDGDLVSFLSERKQEPVGQVPQPAPDQSTRTVSPISQALSWLGVERGSAYDEFEAVGLERHRHTDDWGERLAKG